MDRIQTAGPSSRKEKKGVFGLFLPAAQKSGLAGLLTSKAFVATLASTMAITSIGIGRHLQQVYEAERVQESPEVLAGLFPERSGNDGLSISDPDSSLTSPIAQPGAGLGQSLSMIAGANNGSLKDPLRDPKDLQQNAVEDEAEAGDEDEEYEEDPSSDLLSALDEMTGAAGDEREEKEELPDIGIRKLRDGLGSAGPSGRLVGGRGMAGGIHQKFLRSGMKNKLLARRQLKKDALSRLRGIKNSTRARLKRSVLPRGDKNSPLHGAYARRLQRMSNNMRPTAGMEDLDAASALQTFEWENPKNEGSGDGSGMSGSALGSGIDGQGIDGGSSAGGGGANPGQPREPFRAPRVSGKNKTPDQGLINAAQILMLACGALLIAAAIVGMVADSGGPFTKGLTGLAAVLAGMAAAVALGVAGIGGTLISKGHPVQGGIFTAIGAVLAIIAAIVTYNYGSAYSAMAACTTAANGVGAGANIAALLTGIGGLGAGGATMATQHAQNAEADADARVEATEKAANEYKGKIDEETQPKQREYYPIEKDGN